MKTILKNVGKVVLAIGLCVFTSTIARAIWDSTTGNMPNFYRLCWGLNSTACLYGNTVSNNVSIQTGGTDALTIDSAQAVAIGGNATVTGTLTNTGILTANSAIRLTALNGSTTGQTIVAAASQLADLLSISSRTATAGTVRVAAGGQVLLLRATVTEINTLVPEAVGAAIICTNCTIPYSLCTATGTAAAQWARAGSATVGCGSNN